MDKPVEEIPNVALENVNNTSPRLYLNGIDVTKYVQRLTVTVTRFKKAKDFLPGDKLPGKSGPVEVTSAIVMEESTRIVFDRGIEWYIQNDIQMEYIVESELFNG